MTAALLPAIVAAARKAADERERATERGVLDREMDARTPGADAFRRALAGPAINIIAECKQRSPSRGVLRRDYRPADLASTYANHGAAAVSVLTEPTFFGGSLGDLRAVRRAVDIPLLRKDFIVTEYQLREARAAGADAVLLIVAALDAPRLSLLMQVAESLELATLVEVHDAHELRLALDVGATVVGVNSRDLRLMQVQPETFERLAARIPSGVLAVAESGLHSAGSLARLKALRYNAFLIGERLVVESDPGKVLGVLRAAGASGEPS